EPRRRVGDDARRHPRTGLADGSAKTSRSVYEPGGAAVVILWDRLGGFMVDDVEFVAVGRTSGRDAPASSLGEVDPDRDHGQTHPTEGNTMSWFMRRAASGSAKAEREASGSLAGGDARDLAAFGLLPVERARPHDPLFAREVQITVEPHPEDWESVHLNLL